jgi:L-fuculose-phosphate aldolase
MPDSRADLKECELCSDNSEFRPGTVSPAPAATSPAATADPAVEAMVQKLTDEILSQLKTQG